MSINDKFTYLQQTKEKIKTAIQNKGVDVSDADTFRSYAEKIALIEGGGSGGDTTWAYHLGQAVAGDKVMLTKVNSLVTPDDAFCNGFRPCLIFNGYAYGVEGEASSIYFSKRRQIVNGVIDSSVTDTISTSSQPFGNVSQKTIYGLNGTVAFDIATSDFNTHVSSIIVNGTNVKNSSVSNVRAFFCEKSVIGLDNSSGSSNSVVDYETGTETSTGILARGLYSFAFEDSTGEFVYIVRNFQPTNSSYKALCKYTKATGTYEELSESTFIVNTNAVLNTRSQLFLQTKDCKYLLNVNAYIVLDVENNTFTFNDYPPVILNEIGDRTIYCMQVFYDGYFSIQLSDGTTLMCKYTNSMDDVEIKEIIEPIIIEGDETIYQRHFSPDRMYWVNRPVRISGVTQAVPLANNPAGPYKAKEATSDYVAYTPSKDRFNSTVLTGFLTGDTKTEDGRQMIEVKTALGI